MGAGAERVRGLRHAGQHRAFSVPAGGARVPDCRPPGGSHPAPTTLELMAALTDGDWIRADAADPGPA